MPINLVDLNLDWGDVLPFSIKLMDSGVSKHLIAGFPEPREIRLDLVSVFSPHIWMGFMECALCLILGFSLIYMNSHYLDIILSTYVTEGMSIWQYLYNVLSRFKSVVMVQELLIFIFVFLYTVDLRDYIIGQDFPKPLNVPEDVNVLKNQIGIFNTHFAGLFCKSVWQYKIATVKLLQCLPVETQVNKVRGHLRHFDSLDT